MTDEDILECIIDIDSILSEVEKLIEEKKYSESIHKIKEARSIVEDLKEVVYSDEDRDVVEFDIMKKLK